MIESLRSVRLLTGPGIDQSQNAKSVSHIIRIHHTAHITSEMIICFETGMDRFEELLEGAHFMVS